MIFQCQDCWLMLEVYATIDWVEDGDGFALHPVYTSPRCVHCKSYLVVPVEQNVGEEDEPDEPA